MKNKNKFGIFFQVFSVPFFFANCISIPKNSISFENMLQRKKASNTIMAIQISDCHFSKEKELFDSLVNTINQLNPDVVFLTGDQIVSVESIKIMEHYLSKINVPCPKFVINGNWEYTLSAKKSTNSPHESKNFTEYYRALKDSGFTMLLNQGETLNFNGKKLVVYGLDSMLGGKPDFKNFTPVENAANVVLGHCPMLFEQLEQVQNIPIVMLSGHTHGGQVLLFGKALYFPAGTGKYYAGIYKNGTNTLYVSTGVGNSSLEIRNIPPCIEIVSFIFDENNNYKETLFQTVDILY